MIDRKTIAVLGGGNGGHAMAADLAMKGYHVRIWEHADYKEAFAPTLERQSIHLIDAWGIPHDVKVARATLDIREAISGAGFLMITAPAEAAVKFFEMAQPHLENGQAVVKWSGNFSALLFARRMKDAGVRRDVILAEAHTLPWGCRMNAPGSVQIMVWVTRLFLATFPSGRLGEIIGDVAAMYPVVPAENVLATSLNNLNPTVHPVGTVMNAGWIDTAGKDFFFYRDGNTLSISRGIKAVYGEVAALAQAVGVSMAEYPEDDFWKKSAIMSTNARAAFDKEGMVAKISGPSSVRSRYITEDLPQGLVPMAKLARQFGVPTPVIDAVIALGSVINQTDYLKEGLSLQDLGLSGLNKQELARYLNQG
jgi:opine dehydrogenase